MAQVQLATKISIETHYKLDNYSKETGASKSSIVDAALVQFIDKNNNQIELLTDNEKPKVTRGKDGKFKKNK